MEGEIYTRRVLLGFMGFLFGFVVAARLDWDWD